MCELGGETCHVEAWRVFFFLSFSVALYYPKQKSAQCDVVGSILLCCTFETQRATSVCVGKTLLSRFGDISARQKMENQKGQKRKKEEKVVSILGGIHHRDGGGVPGINLSHAFSVLLTFSLSSPKRRVVCQRAFIKAERRAKQCGGKGGREGGGSSPLGTCRQVITGKVPLAAESSLVPSSAWDEETSRIHSGCQTWCMTVAELPTYETLNWKYFCEGLFKYLFRLTLEKQACYFRFGFCIVFVVVVA